MQRHHEDITRVDLMLTESSQVIEVGPGEGEQQRPGKLRKLFLDAGMNARFPGVITL